MPSTYINWGGFEKLQRNINKLQAGELRKAEQRCINEMAAVYLRSAKLNTPVGERRTNQYIRKGKTVVIHSNTEHMRRSWNAGAPERFRGGMRVAVFNTASYASYVNDGHRQRPGRFVLGLHITDKAEKAVRRKAQAIMRRHINTALRRGWKQ